ncbi:MAG: undecaprenyl diphosphate synthase [Planctomycetota bacterium]|jgi:undecaprenyl diphosphate synthase
MALEQVVRPDIGGPFPEHIAIVMDGNGRWAKARGMPRIHGHRAGVGSVREITTACAKMGVKSLTLYAFSVENWRRPGREVGYLMRLLRVFLHRERKTLMKNDVRLQGLGRLDELPKPAQDALRRTEEMTASNPGMLLRLALSYGSRSELADATKQMCRDAVAGKLDPETIDEESLRAYLYDPETPDPDLMIRTAGEMRISNFLLWQISYSELYVTDLCWPEFRKPQLLEALQSYASRKRKYGGLLPEDAGEASSSASRSTA